MPTWIAWTLLTVLSWGIWAVLSKGIGGALSDAHVQAISTLGVLPVLIALLARNDRRSVGNRIVGNLWAFGSGLFSCAGNIAYYAALSDAKATTIIPFTALYPAVTIALAVPLLKERLNIVQALGIFLSLAAIFLFNVPQIVDAQSGWFAPWILLPMTAVVLWGITGLLQKISTNYISATSSAAWFLIAFIPFAAAILFATPLPSDIELKIWALTAMMGFMLALGNLTVLLAFESGGKASIISPLAGLYPIVSIPIAVIAFHERLGSREVGGIILALIAVVMLSLPLDTAKATA
jgi:transporter family protein